MKKKILTKIRLMLSNIRSNCFHQSFALTKKEKRKEKYNIWHVPIRRN